jgi:hypothetical protein
MITIKTILIYLFIVIASTYHHPRPQDSSKLVSERSADIRSMVEPLEKQPVFARSLMVFISDRVKAEVIPPLSTWIAHCLRILHRSLLRYCIEIFVCIVEVVERVR